MATKASSDRIEIDEIASERIRVPIVGTTPLIVHRFSEKAKRQMLDNMQGRKGLKEAKDPDSEYEAAFYKLPDGRYGLPSVAFKSATVGGCRFYGNSITMTSARQFIFVRGELGDDGQMLVPLAGDPHMREDVVTVGKGGHDLRYRPQFTEWSAILTIDYITSALTRASMLSLLNAGGMGVGVGEWRPERKGDFGTYRIDPDQDVEVIA